MCCIIQQTFNIASILFTAICLLCCVAACVTLYSNNVFVQALFAIIFIASVFASALRVLLYVCNALTMRYFVLHVLAY